MADTAITASTRIARPALQTRAQRSARIAALIEATLVALDDTALDLAHVSGSQAEGWAVAPTPALAQLSIRQAASLASALSLLDGGPVIRDLAIDTLPLYRLPTGEVILAGRPL